MTTHRVNRALTNTDLAALVQRLRAATQLTCGWPGEDIVDPVLYEAADAIESLQARVGELERERDEAWTELRQIENERLEYGEKMRAENERLRAALSGISSCCTCEACRNAALKALNPEETP